MVYKKKILIIFSIIFFAGRYIFSAKDLASGNDKLSDYDFNKISSFIGVVTKNYSTKNLKVVLNKSDRSSSIFNFDLTYKGSSIVSNNNVYKKVNVSDLVNILTICSLIFNQLQVYNYSSSFFDFDSLMKAIFGITNYLISYKGKKDFDYYISKASSQKLGGLKTSLDILYDYIYNTLNNPLNLGANINFLMNKLMGVAQKNYIVDNKSKNGDDDLKLKNYDNLQAFLDNLPQVNEFTFKINLEKNKGASLVGNYNSKYFVALLNNGSIVEDPNLFNRNNITSQQLFELINSINNIFQYVVSNSYSVNINYLNGYMISLLNQLSTRNLFFLNNSLDNVSNLDNELNSSYRNGAIDLTNSNNVKSNKKALNKVKFNSGIKSKTSSLGSKIKANSKSKDTKKDLLNFLEKNYSNIVDGNNNDIKISKNKAKEFFEFIKSKNYILDNRNLKEIANFFKSKM